MDLLIILKDIGEISFGPSLIRNRPINKIWLLCLSPRVKSFHYKEALQSVFKKDIDILLDAYNDKGGVTATFNLNLLQRINNELGGHFDLSKFRHFSTYNVFSGAMESYLVSLEKQEVLVEALENKFHFRAWEPIHTEYSYKYLEEDIHGLASKTGFHIEAQYFDAKRQFVDALWRVKEQV